MLLNSINLISKRFYSDATTSYNNIPECSETSNKFTENTIPDTFKNTKKRKQQRTVMICFYDLSIYQNLLSLLCLYYLLLMTLIPNTTALRCYEKTEVSLKQK